MTNSKKNRVDSLIFVSLMRMVYSCNTSNLHIIQVDCSVITILARFFMHMYTTCIDYTTSIHNLADYSISLKCSPHLTGGQVHRYTLGKQHYLLLIRRHTINPHCPILFASFLMCATSTSFSSQSAILSIIYKRICLTKNLKIKSRYLIK